MNEQANTDIVKQCYEAFGKGDIQRLLAYMQPDIEWELPVVPGVAFSGKRSGTAQVAEFFRMLDEAQSARLFEPRDFIAQGDRVAVIGHYAWTVKASGAQYESDWIHLFTLRDGKVAAFREFTDTHSAALAYQAQAQGMMSQSMNQGAAAQPAVH